MIIELTHINGDKEHVDISTFEFAYTKGTGSVIINQNQGNYKINRRNTRFECQETLDQIAELSCGSWCVFTQNQGGGMEKTHQIDGRRVAINRELVSLVKEGKDEVIIQMQRSRKTFWLKETYKEVTDCLKQKQPDAMAELADKINSATQKFTYNKWLGAEINVLTTLDSKGQVFTGVMPDTTDGVDVPFEGQEIYLTKPDQKAFYFNGYGVIAFFTPITHPRNMQITIRGKVT